MTGLPDVVESDEFRAHNELLRLLRGYAVTQIGAALAELGVAEALDDRPQTVDTLAATLALPPPSLHRLLRAAATVGLVEEHTPGAFVATALSLLLRPGVPGSLHNFARTVAAPGHWLPWGRLAEAVRADASAATAALGASQWEYYAAHPDEGARFAATMSERTASQVAAVVAAVDLSSRRRIVDVGGSEGALLAALLSAQPDASGVLFDRPEVVAGVPGDLGVPALAGRVEVVGGDFLEGVPAGGDTYVMKNVLHDWSDDDALRILESVRRAVDDDGELLVIELVLPPAGERSIAHLVDLSMLVTFGGRERTHDEFRELFDAGGFALADVVALSGQVDRSVLIARPRMR